MNQFHKILAILIFLSFVFCGCKKNNNPDPSKFSIVGKWTFSSDSLNTFISTKLIQSMALPVTSSDYEQFNSDGTGLISVGGITANFTYNRSNGNSVSISEPEQMVGGMSIPGTGVTATIKKLTNSELYLYVESVGYNNGITYTYAQSEHFVKN